MNTWDKWNGVPVDEEAKTRWIEEMKQNLLKLPPKDRTEESIMSGDTMITVRWCSFGKIFEVMEYQPRRVRYDNTVSVTHWDLVE